MPPPPAAAVCGLFPLKPPAAALLVAAPDVSAPRFFDTLVATGHLADARRLLAHALPPRRAVWWAGLCLHHSTRAEPLRTPAETAAFRAAMEWVLAPTEGNRRLAEKAGKAVHPPGAAGTLAMAVYLAGGSISKPGLPPVHPQPHLCGRLCGVVVYLAAVRFDPARYKPRLREYLAIGKDVARGVLAPPPATIEDVTTPMAGDAFPGLSEKLAAFLAGGPGA